MQKPLEAITPQTFQDRLRAYVSEVMEAGQKNGVEFEPGFYLGFDQYRDTPCPRMRPPPRLPANSRAFAHSPAASSISVFARFLESNARFLPKKAEPPRRPRPPRRRVPADQVPAR